MSVAKGAYLGGIRAVEDLRLRSRVDEITGCWHWSLSVYRSSIPRVYLVVDGKTKTCCGRNAALFLAGREVPKGHVAFPTRECESNDCVNPDHARSSTRKNHAIYLRSMGRTKTPAKTAAIRLSNAKRAKLTMEDARAIRASDEPMKQLAKKYGIDYTAIWAIKAGKSWKETIPGASVFNWRPA